MGEIGMNVFNLFNLDNIYSLTTTWGILESDGADAGYTLYIPSLIKILDYVGIMGSVIIIISSLIMLLVVNYPKTVAQTKQRIAQSFFSVIVIGLLPLIFDVIYTIVLYGAR